MNLLLKVLEAERSGKLSKPILKKIKTRIKYVVDSINKIEKASGLKYPTHYIEPNLPISSSQFEMCQIGILYARTIPIEINSGLKIIVQISAPLVAFGLITTIRAILAHEFLHYIELLRRFNKLELVSDSRSTSLFESLYSDEGRLIDPKLLFKDKKLVRLIEKKISNGINDEKLHKKTIKEWLEKDLPRFNVAPESNVIKIPLKSILNMEIDPLIKQKLKDIE